jgi:hypothetical protein
MGLSISVGALAYALQHDPEAAEYLRGELVEINRVLRDNKLPEHQEPETLPAFESRFKHAGQPYDWLHYLRRAVAYAIRDPSALKPNGRRKDPAKDPLYDDVLFSCDSHLICHSDCDGYYVPIDFPDPLYDELPDEDEHCVAGGILGSSQAVMRELLLVAPLLNIPVADDGAISDENFKAIHDEKEKDSRFWIERQVWLNFFEETRFSLAYRTAIRFG